jgi:transposase
MEACSGSHFLGRALRDQGHDVRLMPAQAARQERFSQKALLAYEGSSGGWPNSHVLD